MSKDAQDLVVGDAIVWFSRKGTVIETSGITTTLTGRPAVGATIATIEADDSVSTEYATWHPFDRVNLWEET